MKIDLLQEDLAAGKHWMAQVHAAKMDELRRQIRAKHRAKYLRRRHGKTTDYDPGELRDPAGRWTGGGGGAAGLGAPPGAAAAAGAAAEAAERASEAAGGYRPLAGLPQKPIEVGGGVYVPGPIGRIQDAARAYMRGAGLPYDPPATYAKLDKARAGRIAGAFDEMAHDPDNPAVKASYEALKRETMAQWQAVKASGLKVDWIKPGQPDPYAESPRLAAIDVRDHNHWWGFPTDLGFGSGTPEAKAAIHDNPLYEQSGETIGGHAARYNDLFRVVHDYFGHFKEGVGFRAEGEENAWRSHAAMYSPAARGAMTSETRGQNSWVNYGPHGDKNRTASSADTVFADQKIGLMPEWTWREGARDAQALGMAISQTTHIEKAHDREAAGVLFRTKSGHMLLMKRADTGEWSIPAGHLEPNEEPLRAAQREAAEETGWPGNHRAYKVHEKVTRGVRFHTFVQPSEWQFKPILNPEHTQHGWYRMSRLPSPLHPGLVATLHYMSEGGQKPPS